MPSALIEFHAPPDRLHDLPRPYPAAQVIPDWYKHMPAAIPNETVGTAKRCMPFLDALTCGYIIPLPADIHITSHRTSSGSAELKIQITGFAHPLVDMHPQNQYPGAPFANLPVLKFINPWIIKTPPGYSTLFLPPMNRFAAPIVPLCGVVETDRYYHEIHFPSVCLLQPGASTKLSKGTPLVQVMPFERQTWGHEIAAWDETARKSAIDALAENAHVYRDQSWVKKAFG